MYILILIILFAYCSASETDLLLNVNPTSAASPQRTHTQIAPNNYQTICEIDRSAYVMNQSFQKKSHKTNPEECRRNKKKRCCIATTLLVSIGVTLSAIGAGIGYLSWIFG